MPRKKNELTDSTAAPTPAAKTSRIRRAPPALAKPLNSSRVGENDQTEMPDTHLLAPAKVPEVTPNDPFKTKIVAVNGRTISQKHAMLLDLVQRPEGATLDELMTASGWQKHSVRGFIAGFVKKTLGLNVLSTRTPEGARCYRVMTEAGNASG